MLVLVISPFIEHDTHSFTHFRSVSFIYLQCALVHEQHNALATWFNIHKIFCENRNTVQTRLVCFLFTFTLHEQVFYHSCLHLLAVSVSSRPSILFISRPSTQFPMVLCLCVMYELWPVSWYCWTEWSECLQCIITGQTASS